MQELSLGKLLKVDLHTLHTYALTHAHVRLASYRNELWDPES